MNIDVNREAIAAFCQRHHIRRMAFFGSVLHDHFRPDSDVDVLVEFEPDQSPGWAIVGMEDDLSELLGRRVDLLTFKGLHWRIRERVLSEAQDVYAAG